MTDQAPVMYGIANCDTIKKARKWMQQQGIDYQFHDYKKLGTDEQQLKTWLKELGWEQLINKRGTTWRKLDETVRVAMNDQKALEVMQQNPSIIKRPLLEINGKTILGFNATNYEQELLSS